MFLSENHLLVKEINYYNFQLIFGRKKKGGGGGDDEK